MPSLGLKNSVKSSVLSTPGIIRDGLVLKHDYIASSVVPVSDGAAYFNNDNDNIQFSTITLDSHGNGSVVFWAKRYEVSASDTVIGNVAESAEGQIRFQADGTIDFESDTNGDTAAVTLNVSGNNYDWHHYAFICTSGTLSAYQDGVSCSVSSAGMSDDMTLNVMGGDGTDGTGSNYAGYLCNVGLWSRAIADTEVKSIMNKNYAGLTGGESFNLISWWNLDTETNTSGEAGTGGVKDSEGTNHGTLS